MASSALVLVDPNELRTAAFAAILAPWARQAEADLHVVHDPEGLADLLIENMAACLYSIGGLSLRDPEVGRTIDRLQGLFPDAPLIVFSDVPDSLEIAMAIHLGLRGFIPTTMSSHVALAAIHFILNGGTYHPHSPASARSVVPDAQPSAMIQHIDDHRAAKTTASGPASLSSGVQWHASGSAPVNAVSDPSPEMLTKRRHVEVLEFLALGETNKEIARHLNLTEATIKVYVRELMRHFGAKNRMQVALKAVNLQSGTTDPAVIGEMSPPSTAGAAPCAMAR